MQQMVGSHRYSRIPICGLVLIMAVMGCRHTVSTSPAPAVMALRAVSEDFNGSPASRDANAIVKYFAADVVVMSPQGRAPVRGVEANRTAWERFFRGANPIHTMTTDTVVVSEGGDMGYTLGHWTVGVDTPGGRAEAAGEYLAVWRRRGGNWRIVAFTAYTFR